MKVLKDHGVEIIELSDAMLGSMQEKAKPVYDDISNAVGAELVGKLQNAVAAASNK